jgi:AcrR family transcriptional regulator
MAGNSNKRKKQAKRKVRGRTSRSQAADDLARIALNLFAEHHYASVTIKDIGRAAKVNTAMIYYYYADKRALFRPP